MYKEAFKDTWKDLKNNPILFLPDLIMLIMTFVLGLLFLHFSGIAQFLKNPDLIVEGLKDMLPLITQFFAENLLKLILALTMFLVTSFLIGSSLLAMKLGMMKDFMLKKKLSIKIMYKNTKYFWNVVYMKGLLFLVGIIFFLFFIGAGLILNVLLPRFLAILLTGLIFLIVILLLALILLFRYQIMFLDKKNPIIAIKDSLLYFRNNKKRVLIVWLIIFAFTFVVKLLEGFISSLISYEGLIYSVFILGAIRSLINILVSVWSGLFRFRIYQLKGLIRESP